MLKILLRVCNEILHFSHGVNFISIKYYIEKISFTKFKHISFITMLTFDYLFLFHQIKLKTKRVQLLIIKFGLNKGNPTVTPPPPPPNQIDYFLAT